MPTHEFNNGELDGFFKVGERLLGLAPAPGAVEPGNGLVERVEIACFGESPGGAVHTTVVLTNDGVAGLGALLGISRLTNLVFEKGSVFERTCILVKVARDAGVMGVHFSTADNPDAYLIESLASRRPPIGSDYVYTPGWSIGRPEQDEALGELADPKILTSAGSYAVSITENALRL